jgi:CubicO group peptidase (beta-lactamase class C family)
MFLRLLLAATSTQAPPCSTPDTGNVAQFISRFITTLPPAERVPRGAFVLVCGDHIAYAVGFGKSFSGAQVDPQRTLFRAASNSKLVTATAALQLAATGQWKLTDDLSFVARLGFTPASAIVRRMRRRARPVYSAEERKWWRWSGALSALSLAAPIFGLSVAFLSFRPGPVAIPRAAIAVGIWLTVVSIAGLTLAPMAVTAWRRALWFPARRVVFTAVAVGFVIGAPLLAFWRVLPF